MKKKRGKNTFWNRLLLLAVILGFTFLFWGAGCAAGKAAELVVGGTVDIAEWGGVFGLTGFFVGVLFLMRQSPVN